MVKLWRRFLVLAVLAFWQGGFTFYAAVVVPIGAEVLGSHVKQGFITQRVTNALNLAGAIALPIFAWDMAVSSEPVRWRRRGRWAVWGLLAATLVGLAWLHIRLDGLLDLEQRLVVEAPAFRGEHQQYLLVSTVQWAAAVAWLALGLWAWRAEDTQVGKGEGQSSPSPLSQGS